MTPEDYDRVCNAFQQVASLPLEEQSKQLNALLDSRDDLIHAAKKMLVVDQNTVLGEPPIHGAVQHWQSSAVESRESTTSLPGYQILDELGRGGMGVVFKARQISPDRVVAIKMILSGNLASTQEVHRFRAEAEAAANLTHSGIVPIFEVGHHQGQHFFSMGFVEGQSLDQLVKSKQLSAKEVCQVVLEIAKAMAHAHDMKIIHRDLKPSNILLDRDGHPKVTDFGLAKRVDMQSDFTHSGQIIGSPGYMSPEQASGATHKIDSRTDIYGLGAVMYALLTGRPPIEADNLFDAIDRICNTQPISPRKHNRDCSRAIETICLKCLHKSQSARYADMRSLADDLEAVLHNEPIKARPLNPIERLIYWARQKPGLSSTLAVVIVFFGYHFVLSYLLQEPISAQPWFRIFSVGIAAAASSGAFVFQRLYERPQSRRQAIYGWMTWNTLILTVLLVASTGASSPMTLIYLLLIAASATLYEKGLVGYTMALAIGGYLTQVGFDLLNRPEAELDGYRIACMLLTMVVLGMIQYFVVRRIRSAIETQKAY